MSFHCIIMMTSVPHTRFHDVMIPHEVPVSNYYINMVTWHWIWSDHWLPDTEFLHITFISSHQAPVTASIMLTSHEDQCIWTVVMWSSQMRFQCIITNTLTSQEVPVYPRGHLHCSTAAACTLSYEGLSEMPTSRLTFDNLQNRDTKRIYRIYCTWSH